MPPITDEVIYLKHIKLQNCKLQVESLSGRGAAMTDIKRAIELVNDGMAVNKAADICGIPAR